MTEQTAVTFKSSMNSVQYVFKDGTRCWFIDGLYKTSNPKKIAELQAEVEAGHPIISLAKEDEGQSVLDENDIVGSFRERIRREIIEEEKAKMRAATDKSRDMGTSDTTTPLKPTSSNDGPIALEASLIANASDSSPVAEQVATAPVTTATREKLNKLIAK
jgi:hypothetical protein